MCYLASQCPHGLLTLLKQNNRLTTCGGGLSKIRNPSLFCVKSLRGTAGWVWLAQKLLPQELSACRKLHVRWQRLLAGLADGGFRHILVGTCTGRAAAPLSYQIPEALWQLAWLVVGHERLQRASSRHCDDSEGWGRLCPIAALLHKADRSPSASRSAGSLVQRYSGRPPGKAQAQASISPSSMRKPRNFTCSAQVPSSSCPACS